MSGGQTGPRLGGCLASEVLHTACACLAFEPPRDVRRLNLPRPRRSVSHLQPSHPPVSRGGERRCRVCGSVLRATLWAGVHWAAGLGSHALWLWAPRSPWPPQACRFGGGPHFSGLSPAAPASCRLNSTEYGELCEKLWAPIRSAANVVIRQSLGDLFLETFASLVEANPVYSVPSSQVGG